MFLTALALAGVSAPLVETQWINNYPAQIQPVLRQWLRTDVVCRGESGDRAYRACDARDNATSWLNARGWCYGMKGQANYQYRWHHCRQGSWR